MPLTEVSFVDEPNRQEGEAIAQSIRDELTAKRQEIWNLKAKLMEANKEYEAIIHEAPYALTPWSSLAATAKRDAKAHDMTTQEGRAQKVINAASEYLQALCEDGRALSPEQRARFIEIMQIPEGAIAECLSVQTMLSAGAIRRIAERIPQIEALQRPRY